MVEITAEIKGYCLIGGKCLSPNVVYQRKFTSSQPKYTEKVSYCVAEKSFKKDSTTSPSPLLKKITRSTQNCRKNTAKSKLATLFQK